MKRTVITIIISIWSTLFYAQNGQKNFIDQNYIEVTGTVETELVPNEIYVSIQIAEKDKKGKISVEQQENSMMNTLKNLGIDLDKFLKIRDFTSNYRFHLLKKTAVLKSKEYQLVVHDGITLGKVYQSLESIGISNISIIKVSHSELEKHQRLAKLNALKIAKEKASDYAKTIDQSIGKALYIQEISNPGIGINNLNGSVNGIMLQEFSRFKSEKINHLEFQSIRVQATVLTRFELN